MYQAVNGENASRQPVLYSIAVQFGYVYFVFQGSHVN